jgi:hypothetical protein
MANVLKMATVADIVTWIQAGFSDRRISALPSLDHQRRLQNPPNAPTGPVIE